MRHLLAFVVIFAVIGCGGSDPSGTYAGTLTGNYTDMDAPGPGGTGMNRTFQFHDSTRLVVSKLGDNDYRFQIGTCSLSASQVGTLDAPIGAIGSTCTLRLAGHGAITLTNPSGTVTLHANQVTATLGGSGPRHPDGMTPALNATFTGERSH